VPGPPSPSKLAISCPDTCNLHPSKIGSKTANALRVVRENGAGIIVFQRRAEELIGRPLNRASLQRHLKHYVLLQDQGDAVPTGPKPSDLEILDAIITSGFHNSKAWKPTIRDTLEAMKLKVQMTGNSAFDDLISLFDSAADPDEPELGSDEAPEAVLSPEEMPDDHDEDLGEPLAGE
jgi:hypothetical protein